jgi:ferritin
MLSNKVEEALNAQVNAEMWSAYFYLSMSCHFASEGLAGVANWYNVQSQEEQAHALKLIKYLVSRNSRVNLSSIADVPTKWNSLKDALNATLAHEQRVTGMINNLYAVAEEEKDYATREMLNGFISEQVEEEDTVRGLIDKINLIGEDGTGIYQFDKELAARVYTTPAFCK